ncbi:GcrA family cell cycle regulator [Aquamicrobium defluvii]|uniref:GcrA cell cycle regulator n=1 Tax=Aquamicrobium defluvii TaxID=69279 RepID=A0A4V3DKJ2_9HYPH|nr:GcrA family cell cycle regulator [Aquamicrobium defluvii]TDR34693.1 hypothetical protein DES43_113124 [Aquamicrobium defluvii]
MSDLPNWKTMEPGARDELLRRYVEEGFSATEIAKKFTGCFRNSIAGRAHRMGLKFTSRQKVAKPEPKPTKSRETTGSWGGVVGKVRAKARKVDASQHLHVANIVNKAESRKADPVLRISRAAAFDPIPGIEPVPYGSSGCKFPVDGLDGPGLLWCGADREIGRPYCDVHSRLARGN